MGGRLAVVGSESPGAVGLGYSITYSISRVPNRLTIYIYIQLSSPLHVADEYHVDFNKSSKQSPILNFKFRG